MADYKVKEKKITIKDVTCPAFDGGQTSSKPYETTGLILEAVKKAEEDANKKKSTKKDNKKSWWDKIKDWVKGKWNAFKNSDFFKTLKKWWKKLMKCPGVPYDPSFKFDSSSPCIPTIKDIMANLMREIFSRLPMKKLYKAINDFTKKIKQGIAFFGALNALRGFTFKNFVGSFLDASGLKNIAGKLGISSALDKAFNSHKGLNYSGFKDYFGFNKEFKKIKKSWDNYKDNFKNPFKGIVKGIEKLGDKDNWKKFGESIKDTVGLESDKDDFKDKYDNIKSTDNVEVGTNDNGDVGIKMSDGTTVEKSGDSVTTTLPDGTKVEKNNLTGVNKTTLSDGTEVETKNGVTTTTLPDGTKVNGNVIQKPDGTIISVPSNGEEKLDDGTIVKGDGTIIKPDGTIIKPDGTIIKPDGTVIGPDGTILKSDGTKINPDGSVLMSDGSVVTSNGELIADNVTDEESGDVKVGSVVVKPDGSIVASSSVISGVSVNKIKVLTPDGFTDQVELKTDSYSIEIKPDEIKTVLPDGTVNIVTPDNNKTILPDGLTVEVDSNGNVKFITPDGVEVTDLSKLASLIEGAKISPNGELILPDGTIIDKNGNIIKPDGTTIKSNGSKIFPNGDVVLKSGVIIKPDGTIIDSNGNEITGDVEVQADGSKILPDGTKILPDGSVELSDGTKILPDGTKVVNGPDGEIKILPDGTKVMPDGVKIYKDGTQELLNGTKILPNGVVFDKNGNIINVPDGAKLLADGSILLSDGTLIKPDGTKVLSDGSVEEGENDNVVNTLEDGTIVLSDGAQIKPDGTKVLSDGTTILPDGTKVLTDGTKITSNGIKINTDGSVEYPNGTVIDSEGNITSPDLPFTVNKDDVKELDGGLKQLPDGYFMTAKGEIIKPEDIKELDDGSKVLPNGIVVKPDGTILSPIVSKLNLDNISELNGTITLPDGNKIDSNGDVELNDGAKVLTDGTKVLSDGTIIKPDGTKILSNGTIIKSDGSVVNENNNVSSDSVSVNVDDLSVKDSNGVVVKSDGTKILPDGNVVLNNGDKILSNGIYIDGNGNIVNEDKIKPIQIPGGVQIIDGTKIFDDGSKLLSDGTKVLSDGSKILTNGITVTANGDKILSNGYIVSGEYIITPNGEKYKIEEFNSSGFEKIDNGVKLDDGTIILNDGTIISSDGKTINIDGSIKYDSGVIDSNGNIVLSNGIKVVSDGYEYDGIKIKFDGEKVLSDGTVVKTDGSIVLSNGAVIKDGEVVSGELPENVVVNSDGSVNIGDIKIDSDGNIIKDDSKITSIGVVNSDGKLLSIDGSEITKNYVVDSKGNIVYSDGTELTNDGYILFPNGVKYKNNVYYIGDVIVNYNEGRVYINDYYYDFETNKVVDKNGKEVNLNDDNESTLFGFFKDGCFYLNSDIKICNGVFYYKDIFEVHSDEIILFNGIRYDKSGDKIVADILFSYTENGIVKRIDDLICYGDKIKIDDLYVYLKDGYYIDSDGNKKTTNYVTDDYEINFGTKKVYYLLDGKNVEVDFECNFVFSDGEKVDSDGNWYKKDGSIVKNSGILELPNNIQVVSSNIIIKDGNVFVDGEKAEKTQVSDEELSKDVKTEVLLSDSYVAYGNFLYDATKKLIMDKMNNIVYDIKNNVYYIDEYYIQDGIVRNKFTDEVVEINGYEIFKKQKVAQYDNNIIFSNSYIENGYYYDMLYDLKIDLNSGDVYLANIKKGNYKESVVKIGDSFVVRDGLVFTDRYIVDIDNGKEIFYNYFNFEIPELKIKVKYDNVYYNNNFIGSLYLNNCLNINGVFVYRDLYVVSDKCVYLKGNKVDDYGDEFIIKVADGKVYRNGIISLNGYIEYKNYIYFKFTDILYDGETKKIVESIDTDNILFNKNEINIKSDNVVYDIENDTTNVNNDIIIKSTGVVYSDKIDHGQGYIKIDDIVKIYTFGLFSVNETYFDKFLNKSGELSLPYTNGDVNVGYNKDSKEVIIGSFKYSFNNGKIYYTKYYNLEIEDYPIYKFIEISNLNIAFDYYLNYVGGDNSIAVGGYIFDISNKEVYYYIDEEENKKYLIIKSGDDTNVYLVKEDGSLNSYDNDEIYNKMLENVYFEYKNGIFYDEKNKIYLIDEKTAFVGNYFVINGNKHFNNEKICSNCINDIKLNIFSNVVYNTDGANDYFELNIDSNYKVIFDNNLLKTKLFKDGEYVCDLGLNIEFLKLDGNSFIINGMFVNKDYIVGDFMLNYNRSEFYFISKEFIANNVDNNLLNNLIVESS